MIKKRCTAMSEFHQVARLPTIAIAISLVALSLAFFTSEINAMEKQAHSSEMRSVNAQTASDQVTRKRDPSRCADALEHHTLCESANKQALELMRSGSLTAITVMQDVRTGALLVFAASDPKSLNVTSGLLPLSTVKLLLAASWWDHDLPDEFQTADGARVSIDEMLVGGSDNAGKQVASKLRTSIGIQSVLKDLSCYGFPFGRQEPMDQNYWATLDPMLKDQLVPETSFNTLNLSTPEEWDDSLSIGEARFNITALHLSRFLQAVGNGGVMLTPKARIQAAEKDDSLGPVNSTNVLKERTALKLQAAMRDTVQRGTANTIANILTDTNWSIGGKTGTGPGQVGPESDGWFAGLVFDRLGHARFTVATYVKHGGRGSGNAARISAELARFIVGANPKS